MANDVTVATLNAKFVADTRELTGGIEEVGTATRNYKKHMRAATTPTETYSKHLRELNALVKQQKLTQEQAARAAAKYRQQLGLNARATKRQSGAIQQLIQSSGFGGIGAAAGGPIGVGLAAIAAAATAATLAMRRFLRSLERIAQQIRAAETFGLALQELQAIQAVGIEAGMTIQSVNMAWQRVTRRSAEAARGTGEAVAAFRELNINAAQFIQLAPLQRAELLAERLATVTNQADRLRISFKLFDSEGARLGVFLGREGPQALREAVALMQRLGALSQREQAIITRAQRNVDQIKQTLMIIVDRIVVELTKGWGDLLGHINRIVKFLAVMINRGRLLVRIWIHFVLLFQPTIRAVIAIIRAAGRLLWVVEQISNQLRTTFSEELAGAKQLMRDLIWLGRQWLRVVLLPAQAAAKAIMFAIKFNLRFMKYTSVLAWALRGYQALRGRTAEESAAAMGAGGLTGQVQTTPSLLAGSREFFTRLAQLRAAAFNEEQDTQQAQLDQLRQIEQNTRTDQAGLVAVPAN